MKISTKYVPFIAGAFLCAAALAPLSTGTQAVTWTSQPIHVLTVQQAAMLSHFSLIDLPDGQGSTVPTIRISGINLQIVNGLGVTETMNGTGNLIVGYNEFGNTDGDDRTGSHNIVGGSQNSFQSFAGLMAGNNNTLTSTWGSATGGQFNRVLGPYSSVTGGYNNDVSIGGTHASVSGGKDNRAEATFTSISGGQGGWCNGFTSSVSGGFNRTAWGDFDWVSGALFQDF